MKRMLKLEEINELIDLLNALTNKVYVVYNTDHTCQTYYTE